MKKCLLLLLLALFALYLPILVRRSVFCFRLPKIASHLPLNPAWPIVELSQDEKKEMQDVLSQPFHYLAHGGQSFVFESEDRRFVIKFFRHSTVAHPWRAKLRRFFLGRRGRLTPQRKTERLFTACRLAYERAKDLTGLVYIHLNPTDKLLPCMTLKDRLGRVHSVDLNYFYFAVQHKGTLIRNAFDEAVQKNDREQFLRLVRQFALLLEQRTERSLANSDSKVGPNFGFLADRAIEWDFGNYWVDRGLSDPASRKREIRLFSEHLQVYLNRIAPQWADAAWQILEGNFL